MKFYKWFGTAFQPLLDFSNDKSETFHGYKTIFLFLAIESEVERWAPQPVEARQIFREIKSFSKIVAFTEFLPKNVRQLVYFVDNEIFFVKLMVNSLKYGI